MTGESGARARVLVVDDSKLMRKAAHKMLGDEFDVVTGDDGVDAWAQIQQDPGIQVVFTVIGTSALLGLKILDFFSISLASFQVGGGMLLLISSLNMLNAQPAEAKPASHELEDGAAKAAMGAEAVYELLRTIRGADDPGVQGLPVIVVTGAENDEAARMKALDQGATDFITKPFTTSDLVARARAHANYQRVTRQLQSQVAVDALTGLANKAGFMDRLQQDMAQGMDFCAAPFFRRADSDRIGYFVPYVVSTPIQLVIRADALERFAPRGGRVSLARLLEDPALQGGLSSSRTYPDDLLPLLERGLRNGRLQWIGGASGGQTDRYYGCEG